MKTPRICRYCGGKVRKGNSREIYGTGNQRIYICTNCNAYVMCHERSGQPMGKLANTVLRLKRREAHEIFDAFWKNRNWSRTYAYRWLAQKLNLPEQEAHIANFEMDDCDMVIRLCRENKNKEAA